MLAKIISNHIVEKEETKNQSQQLKALFIAEFRKGVIRNKEDIIQQFSLYNDYITIEQREIELFSLWYQNVVELAFIEHLINEAITEIHLLSNSQSVIFYHINDSTDIAIKLDLEDYHLAFEILAYKWEQNWNFSQPFVSFQMKINQYIFRCSLLHASCSTDSLPKCYLRLLKNDHFKLDDFEISSSQMLLLQKLITTKRNVLISGSTGSGKTSFLSALIKEIPKTDHLAILEDTHEISTNHPRVSQLLAKEDERGKQLIDYCKYVLRMSPDRVLLGELRAKEVVPFLLAMNTGHNGLLSTIHANGAEDAVHRLTLLFKIYSEVSGISYEDVLNLVCKNLHYVVHIKDKKIDSICQILGAEGRTCFYEYLH